MLCDKLQHGFKSLQRLRVVSFFHEALSVIQMNGYGPLDAGILDCGLFFAFLFQHGRLSFPGSIVLGPQGDEQHYQHEQQQQKQQQNTYAAALLRRTGTPTACSLQTQTQLGIAQAQDITVAQCGGSNFFAVYQRKILTVQVVGNQLFTLTLNTQMLAGYAAVIKLQIAIGLPADQNAVAE